MMLTSLFRQRFHAYSCLVICLTLVGSLSGCRGSGGGGGNQDPTNIGPSSTGLSGTWVGTLSRPGGLSSIAVRWQATHQGQSFTGPATFTYNNVTVTGTIGNNIEGSPASWHADIAFTDASLPNCKAGHGNSLAGPAATVQNLSTTATVLVTNTFAIVYTNCQGFIGQGNVDEPTQLSLSKQ